MTFDLISSIRALASLPQYDDVGVILFLKRLEEIEAISKRLDLGDDFFSVL
jgi:hypothetical protein